MSPATLPLGKGWGGVPHIHFLHDHLRTHVLCIVARYGKRLLADVPGLHVGVRAFQGKCDSDASTSGADVQDIERGILGQKMLNFCEPFVLFFTVKFSLPL